MSVDDSHSGVRERTLEAAVELFYRKGINNVGVDEVVSYSGVSKMSLYKHFGSKDALAVAYIRRWSERWLGWLKSMVGSRAATPRERILTLFEVLEQHSERSDFRGCAFINSAIEVADREHPAHLACVEEQERFRLYILDLVREARVREPEELSHKMAILIHGTLITALIQNDSAPVKTARQAAAALLATH